MERLNIPKLIHIGCQKRDDTYTGQLAYVIYTDEKGKKRKETSWEGWRHKNIDPIDYDNEPTSGFVLNKGVGGARNSWGWNARNEYIRVYDPRGFEFEISVSNLLFILQECNSIKGKGLEGEFVYAWDGTELVLLPTGCEEYKKSVEFTNFKSLKITKKEMTPGCVYQDKNMNNLVYIGRESVRDMDKLYEWNDDYIEALTNSPLQKKHVFYDVEACSFTFERGFTKLATKPNDDIHPEFANLHTKLMNSKYVSPFKQLKLVDIPLGDFSRNGKLFLIEQTDGSYIGKKLVDKYSTNNRYHWRHDEKCHNNPIIITNNMLTDSEKVYEVTGERRGHHHYGPCVHHITKEDLFKEFPNANIFTVEYELESGTTLGVYNYVKRC